MITCQLHHCDYNDCDCHIYHLCEECNIYLRTNEDRDEHIEDHPTHEITEGKE